MANVCVVAVRSGLRPPELSQTCNSGCVAAAVIKGGLLHDTNARASLRSSRPFHALRCRRTRGMHVTFGHEKAPSRCLGRLCGGGPKRITAAGVEPDVQFRVRRGGCDQGGGCSTPQTPAPRCARPGLFMPFAAAAHAVCASSSGMKKPQAGAWGVCVVEVRSGFEPL